MARVYPSDWRALQASGAAARERETIEWLAATLPANMSLLHGVHWTRVQSGFSIMGHVDFVVIGPSGNIVLIEQHSGLLEENPLGLVKRYGMDKLRYIALDIDHLIDHLQVRLRQFLQGHPPEITYLLYCPDYRVRQHGAIQLPGNCIIDMPRRDALATVIMDTLDDQTPNTHRAHRIQAFFAGELELVPDTATVIGKAETLFTRLSGGLATWARRLNFSPFRLHVTATAGSGKTQMAVAVLSDASRQGRRACYLCFNRPLADHIAQVVPTGTRVASFHQFCEQELRRHGHHPNFSSPRVFQDMVEQFLQLPDLHGEIDELIIDEGQDFEHTWVQALLGWASQAQRIWYLEDPMQRLYDRRPAQLGTGWVHLVDHDNYRTPRRILEDVNGLLTDGPAITSMAPLEGDGVEYLMYDDTEALVHQTRHAITQALMARFRKQDIAIVTYRGRDKSVLLNAPTLGGHSLRHFKGQYDLLGGPEFQSGDILLETVYRFKGQSAPCVILTEVDFDALDQTERHKLFVGMTRASMKLYVIVSRRAAALLPGARRPRPVPPSPGPGRTGNPGQEQTSLPLD
jgi:hypothetical protein